jgi:ATP/ADP translocase
MVGGIGMREIVIVLLLVLFLWPYGRILSRVGYSPWLCLLLIVPLVNVIALWLFAYADWPRLPKE